LGSLDKLYADFADQRMGMNANLSERLFPEVLRNISTNAQTGTLVVRRNSEEKRICFEQGEVVFATSNVPEEELGEILIKIGMLSPSQLDEVSKSTGDGRHLSQVLIERGIFDPGRARDVLELQIQEIIYPLFDWNAGEFKFTSDRVSLDPDLKLSISTRNLVLEGIRRIKNFEIIHKGLRGSEASIRLSPNYETTVADLFLKPDEAFILSRIESTSKISEILQISPLDSEMTLKTLYGFISTGVAEFVTESHRHAPAPPTVTEIYQHQSRPKVPATPPPSEVEEEAVEDIETMRSDILSMLEKSKSSNYYDLLQVTSNAPLDEIKKSYYRLAKQYHPDRYHQSGAGELKNALDTIFAALSQAYDTLKVPATRTSYDARVSKKDARVSKKVEETVTHSPERAKASSASGAGAAQQKLAELNYRQGRGHFEQEDYWSASQAFRQSVRLEPENARYRYWLAMTLTKNPKWRREAEEHFLKAIEFEQFNPAHYIGLALLYKEVGLLIRAEAQLRQALQVSPGDKSALEALATLSKFKETEKKGLKSLKNFFRKNKS
jgi:curved DNA-binding protein CbpA